MSVEAGLRARIEREVTEFDTAGALGSGDVPVLASPRLVAWAEAACVAALDDALKAGETTVGTEIRLAHLQSTPVGDEVTISAVLEAVDGRQLTFAVEAGDSRAIIARGHLVRVLVDRDRFLQRVAG